MWSMKHLILLFVVAGVLFTACSRKVRVVIPDGLYEETVHFVRYDVYGSDPVDRKEYLSIDTVCMTQVLIDNGEFIYQDMCLDTICRENSDGEIIARYHSPFIYAADAYCSEITYLNGGVQVGSIAANPAHVTSDGFVILVSPCFFDAWRALQIPKNYTYRAPVINNTGVFRFEQNHEFVHRSSNGNFYRYHIEHTLRRF